MANADHQKEPEELCYVVDIYARHSKTNPGKEVTVKRGPLGIFGWVTRNSGYMQVSGSFSTYGSGTIDVSSVDDALAHAAELRAETRKRLDGWLDTPPKPGYEYDSDIKVALWVGTADQFEPRRSNPSQLRSRDGAAGAREFRDAGITAVALQDFIAGFNTHDRHRQQVQETIEAAIAPVRVVKPMQQLQIKRGP